jgi:signal transduction histidine kinase
LLPEELETKGLKVAIQKLLEELNSLGKTHFKNETAENIGRFDGKIEYEVFSILLEVSNNILKHSQATEAIVILEKSRNNLIMKISDNGIGLSEKSEKNGMGMPNLRSRAASLKGKIDFVNKAGLTVEIEIPA